MFRIAYVREFRHGGHVFSHTDDRKNPAAEDEKRHAHHEEDAQREGVRCLVMQPILAGRARHRSVAKQQERRKTDDRTNDLANSVKHWMNLLRLDGRREPPVDHKVYQHTCHRNI